MQCSEVIGALEEIAIKEEQRVVVMAGSLDRLEEYCRRLHEPGTMVADLARLVRRVDASLLDDEAWRWLLDHGKSSQDGLTVRPAPCRAAAVPCIGTLTVRKSIRADRKWGRRIGPSSEYVRTCLAKQCGLLALTWSIQLWLY